MARNTVTDVDDLLLEGADDEALIERKLRELVAAGDVRAMRLLEERIQRKVNAEQVSGISLTIVPWETADSTLVQVMLEADDHSQGDVLRALQSRLERDNAPFDLQDKLDGFIRAWGPWAREAYYRAEVI